MLTTINNDILESIANYLNDNDIERLQIIKGLDIRPIIPRIHFDVYNLKLNRNYWHLIKSIECNNDYPIFKCISTVARGLKNIRIDGDLFRKLKIPNVASIFIDCSERLKNDDMKHLTNVEYLVIRGLNKINTEAFRPMINLKMLTVEDCAEIKEEVLIDFCLINDIELDIIKESEQDILDYEAYEAYAMEAMAEEYYGYY